MPHVQLAGFVLRTVRLALLLRVLGSACEAFAQARSVESKTADVAIFAGSASNSTAYTAAPDVGLSAGLAMTRYFPFLISPSLEGRAILTDGLDVRQRAYLVGPRVQFRSIRHIHPYVDFLVGRGYVHFHNPAVYDSLGDNAFVKSFGVGVDLSLYKHFELKLDGQAQLWRVGRFDTRNPDVLTVGLNYRIPFRPWLSQAHRKQ